MKKFHQSILCPGKCLLFTLKRNDGDVSDVNNVSLPSKGWEKKLPGEQFLFMHTAFESHELKKVIKKSMNVS